MPKHLNSRRGEYISSLTNYFEQERDYGGPLLPIHAVREKNRLHKVLRLPPYHCIFNPIELIWGVTKNYYNRHMDRDGRTVDKCLDMWKEALSTITPRFWMNSIWHLEEGIERWWNYKNTFDKLDINYITELNNDSETESVFSDSDS